MLVAVELHSIVGENKTRIIGKCTLRMTGLIFPRFELSMGGGRMLKTFRMSGGRSADETLELKVRGEGAGQKELYGELMAGGK